MGSGLWKTAFILQSKQPSLTNIPVFKIPFRTLPTSVSLLNIRLLALRAEHGNEASIKY